MASPIPTQLSPGVKVSEIDLSTFVQPEAQNVGGMVGKFNWGPCEVATSISSESELASIFGKPTLDQSDVGGNVDFLSAANFLKYSNHLKVIRLSQEDDYNSISVDSGITGINSVTNKTIKNLDEFRALGGFSGDIEPTSYFKARYPGNFGDSLKVIVFDGVTAETVTSTLQDQPTDFTLRAGYKNQMVFGVSAGTATYSIVAVGEGAGPGTVAILGVTSATMPWYMVTILSPDINDTSVAFANKLKNLVTPMSIFYATGTTTENWNLTEQGANPDGNRGNYYDLETWGFRTTPVNFNPLFEYGKSPYVITENTTIEGAVDILFPNIDFSNTNLSWRRGATYNFGGATGERTILYPRVASPLVGGVANPTGLPASFSTTNSQGCIFGILNNNDTMPGFGVINPGVALPDVHGPWEGFYENVNIDAAARGLSTTAGARGFAQLIGLTGPAIYHKRNPDGTQSNVTISGWDPQGGLTGIRNNFKYGIVQFGNYSGTATTTIGESYAGVRIFDKTPGTSEYAASVGGSNDELSIAIIDNGGKFGPKGAILEKFELLSKAVDAKNLNGENIFYKDYINNNSQYVYMTQAFGFTGGGTSTSLATTDFGDIQTLKTGNDGVTYTRSGYYDAFLGFGESSATDPTLSEQIASYSIFADDASAVDILFVPESSVATDTSNDFTDLESAIYDSVIEPRKDTLFIVPTPMPTSSTQHTAQSASNAINFRKNLLTVPSNSYTMVVAGRKVFFDTYNNQTRKMALSSDLAGILSAQEIAWESPAGFARGNLKNVIKLETAFSKTDRDELYKNQINFFTQFNDGSGTVLFGDKTLLVKPSAFDRINVRRVFIAAEKAIAKAAKYSLFEFNDEFTRSQFRNLVNPFLANLVAQRGISDYKVVCDGTNNTAQVIDNNQFVADIFIKPLKSINFIQLNFIATRSDFNLTTIE